MPQLEGEQLSGAQELQGRLAWMGVERRLLATPLRAPGSQWERLLPRRDPQDEKTGNHISADPGALEVDAGDRAREQKEEEVEEGDEERQKLEPQRVCVPLENMEDATSVAIPSSLLRQSGLSHACQGPEAFPQLDLRQVLMREFPEENDVPRISRGIHTLSMERMPMHAQCLPEHTVLNYMDRSNRHGHTFRKYYEGRTWTYNMFRAQNGQKAAGSRPSHWNPWQEYPDVANQIIALVIELQQLRRVCRKGGSPDSPEDMEARDWLERAALLKHCVGIMEHNEARLAALRREVSEMKQGGVMDQVAFQRKDL